MKKLILVLASSIVLLTLTCNGQTSNTEIRLSVLETKVADSLGSIEQMSALAIDACHQQVEYLSISIAAAGLIALVLGFAGINYVVKLRKLHNTLSNFSHTAENELYATTYINRAILCLCRADSTTDGNVKKEMSSNALEYIEAAEATGYCSSVLYNWKAYALKRNNRVADALTAAVRAYKLSGDDTYEKARAAHNAACYCAMLNRKTDALRHLKEAVSLRPNLKIVARNDDDFSNLRTDADFLSIVTGAVT